MLRFELSDVRLVEVDLRLKRRLLELVEEVVPLNLGALDKQPLFEKCGDPRNQRHPTDGLDSSDKLVGLSDLLPLGTHHADRRRSGCRLGPGRQRNEDENESEQDAHHVQDARLGNTPSR